jgi:type I restriction enzyme S subunit
MKAGWQVKRLGDLTSLITKGTTPTSVGYEFLTEGVNFLKVECINESGRFIPSKFAHISMECHESFKRSQLQVGDILFSIAGALGRVGFVTCDVLPANINQALAIIRLKKTNEIYPQFVLKALATGFVLEQVDKFKGGVAQQNLSLGQIQEFLISIPPIQEQQRIVAILDKAFEQIAIARANTEKNLQNARALFESHLQNVFSQRGEGWVEKRLDELGTITSSKRIFKNEYVTSGIPFYRTKEVKELANGKEISTELYISRARYEEIKHNYGIPLQGDILLTAIGTIGEIYVVESNTEFYFKDGNVLWLKDFHAINPSFLKYALISFVTTLNNMAHGSAYSALPIHKLNSHKIYVPSATEQVEIVEILDKLKSESQHLESLYQCKLNALDALKKSLLHQAFAGEL